MHPLLGASCEPGLISGVFPAAQPGPPSSLCPSEGPRHPKPPHEAPGPLTMRTATKHASVVFQSPLPVAAALPTSTL